MIDLKNYLHPQNLCHVATKKIKGYYGTKNPTEEQVKKYKIKMKSYRRTSQKI